MRSLGTPTRPGAISRNTACHLRKPQRFSRTPTRSIGMKPSTPTRSSASSVSARHSGAESSLLSTPNGDQNMARKSFASSARVKRRTKNAKHMPDSKIDLSDIPESSTAELNRARRVGRPVSGNAKQLIAIRIAPKLLRQLRRMAAKQSKPYQTLIHEILENSSRRVA